jgi:hypothetical protein
MIFIVSPDLKVTLLNETHYAGVEMIRRTRHAPVIETSAHTSGPTFAPRGLFGSRSTALALQLNAVERS